MKRIIAIILAAVSALLAAASIYAAFAERSALADIGSCYSVKPICIQGRPVCICDYSQNCFWACR